MTSTRPGFIYLGSPYSHQDPEVREQRHLAVESATAWILRAQIWVYSPIVHCHELAKRHALPTDFVFWKEYNKAMLLAGGRLWVLCIPGWKSSRGLKAEILFAHEADLSVKYLFPEPDGGYIVSELP